MINYQPLAPGIDQSRPVTSDLRTYADDGRPTVTYGTWTVRWRLFGSPAVNHSPVYASSREEAMSADAIARIAARAHVPADWVLIIGCRAPRWMKS